MGVLVLAGSVIPCCGPAWSLDSLSNQSTDICCSDDHGNSNSDSNHEKEEENCSPFYTCGNCGGFCMDSEPIRVLAPEFFNDQHSGLGDVNFPEEIGVEPWQPPKIS